MVLVALVALIALFKYDKCRIHTVKVYLVYFRPLSSNYIRPCPNCVQLRPPVPMCILLRPFVPCSQMTNLVKLVKLVILIILVILMNLVILVNMMILAILVNLMMLRSHGRNQSPKRLFRCLDVC